MTNDWNESMKI